LRSVCCSLLLLLLSTWVHADFPTTQPFPYVAYEHVVRHDPDESIYLVTIDLTNPKVRARVAPAGPDPDGPGEWQTTLMPVREIAQREHFDVAINGSFFAITRPTSTPIAEEQAEKSGAPAATLPAQVAGYRVGLWAKSVGWTMTDGKLWSSANGDGWPIVWVDSNRHVQISTLKAVPVDATQIVAGNCYLLEGGKPAEPFEGMMKVRHPRTAIGIDRDGTRLIILAVDGRRPGTSVGMTGPELAAALKRAGAWTAINLDGGGSTTLAMRDPETGEFKVLNQPSDGHERPVSDVLGIFEDSK
jgi:exopolysaccharide biosynthesis protein